MGNCRSKSSSSLPSAAASSSATATSCITAPASPIETMGCWYFLYTGFKPTPHVIVDPSVQSIPDNEFRDCRELVILEFSDEGRLKLIGMNAFRRCESLKQIALPTSVEVLDQSAFGYCTELMRVVLNEGLSYIADSAFEGCASLKEIVIPSTVVVIGNCAFRDCEKLKHVTLNEGLEHIEDQSFEGCGSLQRIEVPTTVEDIGHCAFRGCSQLVDVILNEGLEYIDCQAFEGTAITRISIPSTVEVIKRRAFGDCKNLVGIQFCEEIEAFVSTTSLRDWWHRGRTNIGDGGDIQTVIFYHVIEAYEFFNQRNIPQRFRALKVTTWQMNIDDMMKWLNIHRHLTSSLTWLNAVESKLEHYECLQEASFLLELALWKWKFEEQGYAMTNDNRSDIVRSRHRIACGAEIIIPKVLSFLVDV